MNRSSQTLTLRHAPWVGLALLCLSASVLAREPGVLPTVPSGATMGVPIAAPSPLDGVFLSSRTGYSSQRFYDASGDKTPTDLKIKDTVLQFAFAPGWKLGGGQYRAFVALPYIDLQARRVPTPFGLVDSASSGMGSVEIRPLDLSWETSPGLFVSAGASLFSPGEWSATNLTNVGGNFWSFSPSVGVSYLRDGWNATAHLLYFANQKNRDNDYRSGDEVHLNLTAMKELTQGFSVGPVAYLRRQVSDDKNPSGAYFGFVAGRASSTGVGLSATRQLGPVNLNLMVSRDVQAKNSGGGTRWWLNVIVPLHISGR